MASTDNSLALVGDGPKFLALAQPTDEIKAIIADNLAGQDIGEFDLPRVTVPSGGGTTWTIPGIGGETSGASLLEGIIVHAKRGRTYWASPDPTGEPPDCSSRDGIVGVGDPGGECGPCPFNQFGSEPKHGRGKACDEKTVWFLLRPDSWIPLIVTLPPTSLKRAKQYMLGLAGGGIRYSDVVTSLSVAPEQNAGGQKYSAVVPKIAERLDAETAGKARAYAEMFRPLFDATPPEGRGAASTDGE